jgi:hypothetical protein
MKYRELQRLDRQYRHVVGWILPSVFGAIAVEASGPLDAGAAFVLLWTTWAVMPDRRKLAEYRAQLASTSTHNAARELEALDRQFFGAYMIPMLFVSCWLFAKAIEL